MNTELITQILEGLRSVTLLFALFFALFTVKTLMHKESSHIAHGIKRKVFLWLMWGTFFLMAGVLLHYLSLTFNYSWEWVELLFILHYFFFLVAFAYFWNSSGKFHQLNHRDRWFFLGFVVLVLMATTYLLWGVVLPGLDQVISIENILNVLYPLFLALILVLTYSVHARVKAGLIDRSLWYIANGVFIYFIGYYLYTFTNFKENAFTFLPVIYEGLFLLSSIYYLLGFAVARKKAKEIKG